MVVAPAVAVDGVVVGLDAVATAHDGAGLPDAAPIVSNQLGRCNDDLQPGFPKPVAALPAPGVLVAKAACIEPLLVVQFLGEVSSAPWAAHLVTYWVLSVE
jgi:hypothetical protein